MTKFYYDTEFHERGPAHPIEFISIGIISEHGDSYYAINDGFDTGAALNNKWLRENVMRFIPLREGTFVIDRNHPRVKHRSTINRDLREFFKDNNTEDKVELYAWYADYDHVVLSQIFGRMIDLPDFMPMYTRDLKQEADRLGVPENAIPTMKDSLAHHPLNDAIHVKTIHDFLKAYEREKLGIL